MLSLLFLSFRAAWLWILNSQSLSSLFPLQQRHWLSLLLFEEVKCRRFGGEAVETSGHIALDTKLQNEPPWVTFTVKAKCLHWSSVKYVLIKLTYIFLCNIWKFCCCVHALPSDKKSGETRRTPHLTQNYSNLGFHPICRLAVSDCANPHLFFYFLKRQTNNSSQISLWEHPAAFENSFFPTGLGLLFYVASQSPLTLIPNEDKESNIYSILLHFNLLHKHMCV